MVLGSKRIQKLGIFLKYYGFSRSYAVAKSNLHSRKEISSMTSLTPKLSIATSSKETVSSHNKEHIK